MILLGESSLQHVLKNYVEHYHWERNHQGKGNVILFPEGQRHLQTDRSSGHILKHERLGGLLKYYHREAA
jgi:putative transposase